MQLYSCWLSLHSWLAKLDQAQCGVNLYLFGVTADAALLISGLWGGIERRKIFSWSLNSARLFINFCHLEDMHSDGGHRDSSTASSLLLFLFILLMFWQGCKGGGDCLK